MLTLGIETSCDETAAAVLEDGLILRSGIVSSQVEIHALYGGVVPEIAARKHLEAVNAIIEAALDEAGAEFKDIGLLAVTTGPGLVVSLVVGIAAAKALAFSLGIPVVGVNHLEGHILANLLAPENENVQFPSVCLLVSGGHTEIVLIEGIGKYKSLGGTVDDAVGEAFDKVARLLGLGYPGGPAIQKAAKNGDASKIRFPRPMASDDNYNFSFSGLKTAVVNFMNKNKSEIGAKYTISDVAASFQAAVADVLTKKTIKAAGETGAETVWLAGGVAANKLLRSTLAKDCEKNSMRFFTPAFELCTDNAGMIAKAGFEIFKRGGNGLELTPYPNCPL